MHARQRRGQALLDASHRGDEVRDVAPEIGDDLGQLDQQRDGARQGPSRYWKSGSVL
jgi:hypothetical protein